MTPRAIEWWARGLRRPFRGVYLTGLGPLTQRQRWRAATLTAPHTALAFASAAAAHELRSDPRHAVTVVRPGSDGPEQFGELHVSYSTTLAGHITRLDGLPVTSVDRTVIDLWPHLYSVKARERMVREALRLEKSTANRLLLVAGQHRGRRGVASLKDFVRRFSDLPFSRCKSDAEAYALTVLEEAGVPRPRVNEDFAGEEADLCWPEAMRIVELDGPQYHRLTDEDARKTRAWERAGFRVSRLPTPTLYRDSTSLLALAPS